MAVNTDLVQSFKFHNSQQPPQVDEDDMSLGLSSDESSGSNHSDDNEDIKMSMDYDQFKKLPMV